ncbi:MAG: hypothetical protein HKN36_10855 [Hellea sp.]|nr:hypothetical protein [Hellea sp.]
MSDPLIIWLPEDLDDAWAYYRSAADQGWAADDQERAALGPKGVGGTIIVAPGTWFRIFPHSLPDMKSSERLSAAGFAIEEKLAAPLDEQHIVLGKSDDQRVGVISRNQMKALLDRLDQYKIAPVKVMAEYEAFDFDAGTLAVWGRTIHPGPMGYSMDADHEGDNPLSHMAQMNFENAINYAHGDFVRRQTSFVSWRSLIPVAASLAILGIAWLFWQGAEARAMHQQAANLKAESEQLYSEVTGKPAPPNLTIAINRLNRNGTAPQTDFKSLSASFFNGLKRIDGVLVDTLRYNENRGQLTLKLVYPSFDAATQLEQVFASSAGQFESGSVREQNGVLIGEGTFKMRGGS